LGVKFAGPRFGLRKALEPRFKKDYDSLSLLERRCFQNDFSDILFKMDLMENIIKFMVLYSLEVWGPSLLRVGLGHDKESSGPYALPHC
jgi:hypothetical protein